MEWKFNAFEMQNNCLIQMGKMPATISCRSASFIAFQFYSDVHMGFVLIESSKMGDLLAGNDMTDMMQ